MKSKNDQLSTIPKEVMKHSLMPFFKKNDLGKCKLVNKNFYNLFNSQHLATFLIDFIATGNMTMAEKILNKHPNLIFEQVYCIDHAGREFKIKPLQLALWNLDLFMADMIINCLFKTEEVKIKKELRAQYKNFKVNGVTYKLNDTTITEKHFNSEPILTAMHTLTSSNWDDKTAEAYWINVIGTEQKKLPINILQRICNNSLKSKEDFKRSLVFQNRTAEPNYSFSLNIHITDDTKPAYYEWEDFKTKGNAFNFNKLGSQFALMGAIFPACAVSLPGNNLITNDYNQLTNFFKTSVEDLNLIEKQLMHREDPQAELSEKNWPCVIL